MLAVRQRNPSHQSLYVKEKVNSLWLIRKNKKERRKVWSKLSHSDCLRQHPWNGSRATIKFYSWIKWALSERNLSGFGNVHISVQTNLLQSAGCGQPPNHRHCCRIRPHPHAEHHQNLACWRGFSSLFIHNRVELVHRILTEKGKKGGWKRAYKIEPNRQLTTALTIAVSIHQLPRNKIVL